MFANNQGIQCIDWLKSQLFRRWRFLWNLRENLKKVYWDYGFNVFSHQKWYSMICSEQKVSGQSGLAGKRTPWKLWLIVSFASKTMEKTCILTPWELGEKRNAGSTFSRYVGDPIGCGLHVFPLISDLVLSKTRFTPMVENHPMDFWDFPKIWRKVIPTIDVPNSHWLLDEKRWD